ncbi:BamA/TamA family outer membrane protein [bacterium]|nr:BamA/TamA family outer membrane protein [bacterium]
MRHLRIFSFMLAFILCANGAFTQNFGKNKVNYTPFSWKYIPTKNFDIYYTTGGYEIALIASQLAEAHFEKLSKRWRYTPRKRIPILVYSSFNDFSQTNVITEPIEEGTGGFTEIFKNRVVIPWEGSLGKFRHVIDHELTHALYFDMLYGGVVESIVGREYLFQIPLWFAEGLAEHESQYWSTEADMIVRDGIITGYLPPIENIYSGYLVYKGGESFFKYLQENYGNQDKWITGELLSSLSQTHNLEKTFKSVFGKSIEDLSKEWQRKLRSYHWPEVAGRELPEDFALKLTDHMEERNYLNINPAFNPTGDKIAFLTDRNGYKEIMLMRAADGKIIKTILKGEKAGDYEEMHWLRGGLTWSPDGTMVSFAAKTGERDAIHIKKVEDGGYDREIKLDMDAVYSPSWSPDGSKILFCAIKNGKLDIFTVEIKTGAVVRLTDDFFDESTPRWNSDGTKIVFSSDRFDPPYEFRLNNISDSYDIFIMDADGSNIRRITTNPYNDTDPSWSPDDKNIVFSSDRNGITNIYNIDIESMTEKPLTNLLTGSTAPNWSPDATRIAFTCFKEGGWDIYVLKRPLKRELTMESVTPTAYRSETLQETQSAVEDSSTVILTDKGMGQEIAIERAPEHPYAIKFSPDMFNAFASYNTFYGIGGMGQISLSDIMGNHRINVAGNLFYSIEESDIFLSYFYLKRQTNWGVNAYHYKTYYRSSNWDIFSDSVYGGSLIASRPFSKFSRIDLALNMLSIRRSAYYNTYNYYDPYGYYFPPEEEKLDGVKTMTIESEFVNDNTLWSYTGPAAGRRYKLNVEYSPSLSSSDLAYTTIEADYRKYYHFKQRYGFVTRISGGTSMGETPRMFFLGGTSNWLNARISSIPPYIENRQDLYFARFPFPLRAYRYYELYGRHYFLANCEFRFPFIDYLALGWPMPMALGNITGALFTDVGSAWGRMELVGDGEDSSIEFNDSFHGGGITGDGSFALDDIKMCWGVGMRINIGFAILRIDTAWKILQEKSDPKPMFSIAIGPDF